MPPEWIPAKANRKPPEVKGRECLHVEFKEANLLDYLCEEYPWLYKQTLGYCSASRRLENVTLK